MRAALTSAPLIALSRFSVGPEKDKEAFHRYLADFGAVDDVDALLDSLVDCTDPLPNRYAELLLLPAGSSYRDAIRLLLSSWSATLRAPDFPAEADE